MHAFHNPCSASWLPVSFYVAFLSQVNTCAHHVFVFVRQGTHFWLAPPFGDQINPHQSRKLSYAAPRRENLFTG